jgi:hypothetical protein
VSAALDVSNICILVITPAALSSKWVRDEVAYASKLRTRGQLSIVPIVVAPPGGITDLWTAAVRKLGLPDDLVYVASTENVVPVHFPSNELFLKLRSAWGSS